MDENDSLISELDSEQANAIDSVIGKKIWNIEVLEEGDQSMVKIMFSEDEETDFIKPEILDVRPIQVLTAITEDTPFARVGKMLQSEEVSREGSIDVEQGESRE